jgi:uncharacterized protein (TIGR01777 family)
VINLNGENIGGRRWSPEVKAALRSSRIDATRTIAEAIKGCSNPPGTLINASATGVYGDRADEVLDESAASGEGFLADLAVDWEKQAMAAASDRTRVVAIRLGMVVASEGALEKMLLPFKMGAGGPIGNGRQFWPWIALDDVCGAILHILENPEIKGPVNLVSPEETRCRDFTKALGRVLRRPAFMPAPAFAVRLALGEMADELLLSSTRAQPEVLSKTGYVFKAPDLDQAFRAALGL